jgi:hypothetical protein
MDQLEFRKTILKMNYNLINPEQITNIKVWEKKVNLNWHFTIRNINTISNFFRKLLGMTLLKTTQIGYQTTCDIDDMLFTEKEVLANNDDCYIENNVVYYSPYLTINLSNGKYYTKEFENVESMNTFLTDNNLSKFIKI